MTNKNAELADLLPKWRESENPEDKQQLARYGKGDDLDKLKYDPEEYVRLAVSWERSFKEDCSSEGNPFRD